MSVEPPGVPLSTPEHAALSTPLPCPHRGGSTAPRTGSEPGGSPPLPAPRGSPGTSRAPRPSPAALPGARPRRGPGAAPQRSFPGGGGGRAPERLRVLKPASGGSRGEAPVPGEEEEGGRKAGKEGEAPRLLPPGRAGPPRGVDASSRAAG